jgi:hypothetical protein
MCRGALAPVGAGISFTCGRQQGALFLPRARTDRVCLEGTSDFLRKYIRLNYDHWCTFASVKKGASVQVRESLITLVYGCNKGSAWATAAFRSRSAGGSLHFSTSLVPGIPSAQAQVTWSNVNKSSAIPNWGPKSQDSTPRPSPSISGHSFDDSCTYTFFIRLFRIKKGFRPFNGLKMEARAGPHDLGGSYRDSGGSTAVLARSRDLSNMHEEAIQDVTDVRFALSSNSSCSNLMIISQDSETIIIKSDFDVDLVSSINASAAKNDSSFGLQGAHPLDSVIDFMIKVRRLFAADVRLTRKLVLYRWFKPFQDLEPRRTCRRRVNIRCSPRTFRMCHSQS